MADDHAEYMRQVLRFGNRVVRFNPGQIVVTPSAVDALTSNNVRPIDLVVRHVFGDFGDISEEDRAANETALRAGGRVWSFYTLKDGVRISVITEADRSSTQLLREEHTEESAVVDFDVCYFVGIIGIAPGWYFWFVDQHKRKAGAVIGPFTVDEVYRAGKLAVRCYYDE